MRGQRRGLGPALEGLLATSPVPVVLRVDPLPEADEARVLTAYLVASEAVTNALKHARAQRIDVRVGTDGDQLTVQVSDDGVGGMPELGVTALRTGWRWA